MCGFFFSRKKNTTDQSKDEALIDSGLSPDQQQQQEQEYRDLQYLARKREVKVTIKKSMEAGVCAGLFVMGGIVVAGPVGAVIGGAAGTALAARLSKDVVSLNDLLENTPRKERGEVLKIFRESFQEEFIDSINNNPELRLLLSGGSIFGVARYMLDRDMIENEQLERLDNILRKIT